MAIAVILPLTLMNNALAINHKTEVIQANITGINPIYMNYTIKKVDTPCHSNAPDCWHISYKKETAKVLKGYRVKLAYNDNIFVARMQNKPTQEYLNIRIKSDLLTRPREVAINAVVAY
jgi:hypothetical protein